jgi:hypothetical protein
LDNVVVLESELRQTGLDVPELYGVVARCTSEDVLGGGVEEDVANLPHVAAQLGDRSDVSRLVSVGP